MRIADSPHTAPGWGFLACTDATITPCHPGVSAVRMRREGGYRGGAGAPGPPAPPLPHDKHLGEVETALPPRRAPARKFTPGGGAGGRGPCGGGGPRPFR